MRLLFSLAAGVVLAGALLLAACNSSETKGNRASGKPTVQLPTGPESRTSQTAAADGVRRVTTVELRDALARGTALVVDTRPPDQYKQNHIKGSVNIPVEQIASRINELPRDKVVVTYCS